MVSNISNIVPNWPVQTPAALLGWMDDNIIDMASVGHAARCNAVAVKI
jgi:hypothetical protein